MTPRELTVKTVRLRRWHRWAVLERAYNLPFVWVISFHATQAGAARAAGRRIVRLTATGTGGLNTWMAHVESDAVQSAIHDRRASR